MQVDTIALQASYNSKLLGATYDAMSSLEINTANEDLSAVSDSLRTILEASNNTFFNTLATNFGMSNASKSSLEAYVPAILYTLYDGYYIYSPTEQPIIIKYGYTYEVSGDTAIEKTDESYTGTQGGQPIYDANGNLIGKYTGTSLAGKTIRVPGDTAKIKLISDEAGSTWGFRVTEVKNGCSRRRDKKAI